MVELITTLAVNWTIVSYATPSWARAVFPNEPEVDPRLFPLPNGILLPHMGSATFEGRTRSRLGTSYGLQNLAIASIQWTFEGEQGHGARPWTARSALDAVEADTGVRALVITGAGKAFSVGLDLGLLTRAVSIFLVVGRGVAAGTGHHAGGGGFAGVGWGVSYSTCVLTGGSSFANRNITFPGRSRTCEVASDSQAGENTWSTNSRRPRSSPTSACTACGRRTAGVRSTSTCQSIRSTGRRG